jgi:PIN domain nuclease of toxin-antitoxin system
VAPLIYLDTHVVVWLFTGDVSRLSARARDLVEGQALLISPAVCLELQYLFETGKASQPARAVVEALGRDLGLKICEHPFPTVVEQALDVSWTRDPFDRLIVSQAALRQSTLLTRDRNIRDNYPTAVWD